MKVSKKRGSVWVWLSALILFVFVAASGIILFDRLGGFLLDDSGAISLLNDTPQTIENSAGAPGSSNSNGSASSGKAASQNGGGTQHSSQPGVGRIIEDPKPVVPSGNSGSSNSGSNSGTASNANSGTASSGTQSSFNPGFEAGDEKGVWGTQTQVEIFRVSYENNEQKVTVNSDNGDKLIAPGTENSYTFKLKNTGNVALDYTVELDAYITPQDIRIPIQGRLNRYDGAWIVGDREHYADVSALDNASDKATLAAGKYTYYTLDWQWPFESGDDAWDTYLGDLAVDQDLLFTIVIKTTAEANDNPGSGGGITPPYTGDDSKLTMWIVLAAGSFGMMLLLLFSRNGEKQRHDAKKR